jgi:hypothetical protein
MAWICIEWGFPLSCIISVFSEEEVWSIIKAMSPDKASGPDGFTGRFYQIAWPIIKGDVMNAFHAF